MWALDCSVALHKAKEIVRGAGIQGALLHPQEHVPSKRRLPNLTHAAHREQNQISTVP
jgi:hypothetical protein